MFGIHPLFLIILVVLVLIIFGPGRLPELGGAIGKGIREFRKATDDVRNEVTKAVEAPHESPAASRPADAPTESTPATSSPEAHKADSEAPKI